MNRKEKMEITHERNIRIALSDSDMARISETAGLVGLTVSELLQNFIGDLVYGTYSNGADECMYANQWFDRCWFSMGMYQNSTFLRFLLDYNNSYYVEDVIYCWQKIKKYENSDDEDEHKTYLASQELLNEIYDDFLAKKDITKKPQLIYSMNQIMKWWNERQIPENFEVEKIMKNLKKLPLLLLQKKLNINQPEAIRLKKTGSTKVELELFLSLFNRSINQS